NDMLMNIFESWNQSNVSTLLGSNVHSFAQELDYKTDLTMRIYRHELPDFFNTLPAQADAALAALRPYTKIKEALTPTDQALNDAWSASHHDVTHQHCTTETDSKGDSHTSC